jgi:predicted GH43/DUF377 family glycosyl hydrolase
MAAVPVTRSAVRVLPDPNRVITKPFVPTDETHTGAAETRVARIIRRILAMPVAEAMETLTDLRRRFERRHADLDEVFLRGYLAVDHAIADSAELPAEVRLLIGAYFSHEYAIEAAALTNPSIVPAPDQTGVPDGSLRVLVSLRAVGEGHVSSIEFRTGLLGPTGDIDLDAPGEPMTGRRRSATFEKALFAAKLDEMGAADEVVAHTLDRLEDRFTMASLEEAIAGLNRDGDPFVAAQHAGKVMHWLAMSNYETTFPPESDLSQRVLFPVGPAESHGMEDARMVRFEAPDGAVTYYATYTAYDGFNILPQLIESTDLLTFRVATLNGSAARNKGMAIFPRLVGERYAALARSDGESNYLMLSDHIRFWHDAELIQLPARPWELMQIGNAGAPIETDAGWLVVTHAVGPMRQYSLGAILLDLDEPAKVLGHLRDPLLEPDDDERDGYVPNVVYSCGSILHHGRLVMAYGASDTSTRFASVELDALLAELTRR